MFAGIWTVWGKGKGRVPTCSIVTAPTVDDLALIHDRMPLVLPTVVGGGVAGGARRCPVAGADAVRDVARLEPTGRRAGR